MAVRRQTTVQPPGEEDRLTDLIQVWEAPAVEGHAWVVKREQWSSQMRLSRPGGRLRTSGSAPLCLPPGSFGALQIFEALDVQADRIAGFDELRNHDLDAVV